MSGETLKVSLRVTNGFALDVAFDVPPGVTVLFGPSGSGKSTTLSAIAGLVRPSAGRISIGDDVWFDSATKTHVAVQRRRVAFVFQSLALFPHRTALEKRAAALLDRLRVAHLARRHPRTFSGGEAQRVALARALATSPRVILLDEPFSALDRELRVELIADLRESIRELDVPVLFVTHHRQEARALGERLVVLEAGRVQRVGTVAELTSGGHDASFDETPLDADRMLDP
jgi:molybdate transport system ATP-binding protein